MALQSKFFSAQVYEYASSTKNPPRLHSQSQRDCLARIRGLANYTPLASMIQADCERGEYKDMSINAVESGELSVNSMCCLIMHGLHGEELMADEDIKRKEPREGRNENRGKKKYVKVSFKFYNFFTFN
nr:hypothetical protein [Tanacetum cinerariifolium]